MDTKIFQQIRILVIDKITYATIGDMDKVFEIQSKIQKILEKNIKISEDTNKILSPIK